MRRAPLPPHVTPGDRVELEVDGRLVRGRVASVDHDPVTLEWTYAFVHGDEGGTWKKRHTELRKLDVRPTRSV